MDPEQRKNALILLTKYRPFDVCRDIESAIHSKSKTKNEYNNNVLRSSWNLNNNNNLNDINIVFKPDNQLIEGTILQNIENETKYRSERFEKMLQEKYDSINEKKYTSLITCRRCGSEEVSYDEKQTRSADEAATIYCYCSTCQNRWIMR